MAVAAYSLLIPRLSFPLPQFTQTTIMTNQDKNIDDRLSECIFDSIGENIIIEDLSMEDSSVLETAPEQEDQPESPQEMEPAGGLGSEVEPRQESTPESTAGADSEVESPPESAPAAAPEETASDVHSEPGPELESSLESVSDSSPQPVNEEPTSFQAAANLTSILNALVALQTQITSLREEFSSKLRYDASKKEIIDRQYQELNAYRREIHEKLGKAIVMDLIAEIDGAERSAEHYSALEATPENYAKLRKLVLAHAEDLRDLLENNDIDSYRTEAGAAFNHKRHSILKTVATDDPSLAKTIQASLRWGFEKGGKVIRPEKVAVYVLVTE